MNFDKQMRIASDHLGLAASGSLLVTALPRLLLLLGALFTFAWALPRIARQVPVLAKRLSIDWERLRLANHGFYAGLAPSIAEVRDRVPANATVYVTGFSMVEHQFLANYLAPRRIFVGSGPANDRDLGSPWWVLSLRPPQNGIVGFSIAPGAAKQTGRP